MAAWRELEAKTAVPDVGMLFHRIDSVNVAKLILMSLAEPLVLISPSCRSEVYDYLGSSHKELGGLIFGVAYSIKYGIEHSYAFVSIITDCICSSTHDNTPVSLRMSPEIWSRSHRHLEQEKIVLGWYHSHPNLGAFFSATDRHTQRAFFNQPYSLGIVIDPVRDQVRCFVGADAAEIPFKLRTASRPLLELALHPELIRRDRGVLW